MDYTQICMILNLDMTKVDAVFVTLTSLFKVTQEKKSNLGIFRAGQRMLPKLG